MSDLNYAESWVLLIGGLAAFPLIFAKGSGGRRVGPGLSVIRRKYDQDQMDEAEREKARFATIKAAVLSDLATITPVRSAAAPSKASRHDATLAKPTLKPQDDGLDLATITLNETARPPFPHRSCGGQSDDGSHGSSHVAHVHSGWGL